MKSFSTSLAAGLVLAASLLLLTGCEDNVARDKADAATKAANDAQKSIADLATKDELAKQLKAIRDELSSKIDDIKNQQNAAITAQIGAAMDKMASDIKNATEAAKNMNDQARTGLEQDLKVVKDNALADVQKVRDELKTSNDELKKFMDNQLRDLYPYAYQPHRLEPATPPAPETK